MKKAKRGSSDRPFVGERDRIPTAQEAETPLVEETGGPASRAGRAIYEDRALELREERLAPHKELRQVGEVVVRKEIEEVPGRLEVDAYREEVQIEHVPVGKVVDGKVEPWEEEGATVFPIYEEQLVLVKRLVMREQIRVRRVSTTERRLFQDTLRREKLVVEDPNQTGWVHEEYPDVQDSRPEFPVSEEARPEREESGTEEDRGGILGGMIRRVIE